VSFPLRWDGTSLVPMICVFPPLRPACDSNAHSLQVLSRLPLGIPRFPLFSLEKMEPFLRLVLSFQHPPANFLFPLCNWCHSDTQTPLIANLTLSNSYELSPCPFLPFCLKIHFTVRPRMNPPILVRSYPLLLVLIPDDDDS